MDFNEFSVSNSQHNIFWLILLVRNQIHVRRKLCDVHVSNYYIHILLKTKSCSCFGNSENMFALSVSAKSKWFDFRTTNKCWWASSVLYFSHLHGLLVRHYFVHDSWPVELQNKNNCWCMGHTICVTQKTLGLFLLRVNFIWLHFGIIYQLI